MKLFVQAHFYAVLMLMVVLHSSLAVQPDEAWAEIRFGVESEYFQNVTSKVESWGPDSKVCEEGLAESELADCLFASGLRCGEGKTCMALLRRSAALGSPDALVKLGVEALQTQFEDGHGLDESIEFFAQAVELGDPLAQFYLARVVLLFPEVTDLDLDATVALLEASGSDGIAASYKTLGDIYAQGALGAEVSLQTARDYYSRSSAMGYAFADHSLGLILLRTGEIDEGLELLEKAASSGVAKAKYALGQYYWAVAPRTDESVSKAHTYLHASLEAGFDSAGLFLGHAYSFGIGVEQDYVKSRRYLEMAVGSGDGMAEVSLAHIYARGYGVEQNTDVACDYFEQSANFGNSSGKFGYGLCLKAFGDQSQARKMIEEAAAGGVARAQQYLEENPRTGGQ